jgi:hypothetical protein
MKPRTTAVIVNWNRKADALALLDSVARLEELPCNIVVVDNASTDDSVPAIKAHPLEIILIENEENLGGTGGFNTGIRYSLENLEQDYIWLLDNDATVDARALSALVEVMEQDPRIAIAGSKILNAQDPSYIVETGARINWRTASVSPVNRNVRNPDNDPRLFDVEYVAICSALFRVSALKRIGVMDERYFLLWDDMDWGVAFSQAGCRVVAVNHSVIYHPPFTEKRSLAVDDYYGIRNPLLTVSKRVRGWTRILALLAICRRACRVCFLASLDGQSYAMKLCRQALIDFLCNRWGKVPLSPPDLEKEAIIGQSSIPWTSVEGKVLILNSGSVEEINRTIGLLSANCPHAEIDVALQSDRQELLERVRVSEVITVDFEARFSLLRNSLVFLKLRNKNYHLAVNPSADRTSPFAYVASSLARLAPGTNRLMTQKSRKIVPLILAVALSESTAMLLLPFVYVRSVFYLFSGANK